MNTSPASIRALIVDDETPARVRLRDLLENDSDVAKVYEADHGEDAVRLIQEESLDLVLLQLEALSHGEFEATMKHGGRLRVSRTFRSLLERRLGESL